MLGWVVLGWVVLELVWTVDCAAVSVMPLADSDSILHKE